MGDPGAITTLLQRVSAGDAGAENALLPLVYAELHAIAARYLRGERAGHTLSPTALVHEAWLRLDAGNGTAEDRRRFFAMAAQRMRHALIDHARQRDAAKRGGAARQAVTLSSLGCDDGTSQVDLLALDQALQQLAAIDPRKVRVVELRYFAGLDMTDIAVVLDISRATAQRDWDVARTFLFQALA